MSAEGVAGGALDGEGGGKNGDDEGGAGSGGEEERGGEGGIAEGAKGGAGGAILSTIIPAVSRSVSDALCALRARMVAMSFMYFAGSFIFLLQPPK